MKRYLKGFTLVELMIVMAVIAILATMGLFGLGKAQGAARDVQRQQVMTALSGALERYYGDNKAYPTAGSGATQWSTFLTNIGASYVAAPTDPCPTSTSINANGNPVNASAVVVCAPARYAYTQTTTADYTLTLTKESGGTSTFRNPQ